MSALQSRNLVLDLMLETDDHRHRDNHDRQSDSDSRYGDADCRFGYFLPAFIAFINPAGHENFQFISFVYTSRISFQGFA